MSETTIVVVGYNSAAVLREQAASLPDVPVVLVDNGSRDETAAVGTELGYRTEILSQNVGFGQGAMAGISVAETPLVLVLNPDARISADGVGALEQAASRYSDCDMLVPRLVGDDGVEFFRHECCFEPRVKDRRPPDGDCCVRALSGAALLIRRAPFLAFGGFDPNIFLYFEDDDLALRACQARRPIVHVRDAVAYHSGDASSAGDSAAHTIKDVSFGWSLLYIGAKHFGRSGWLEILKMGLKLPVYALSGRWQRLRRQFGRIRGAWAWLRGKPAPFKA